ncbi:MAG: cytochrome c5 family protein [Proteobacteria bacterium]|nr:cytochrome c5 family protein [Pseudomonadota bacterium]
MIQRFSVALACATFSLMACADAAMAAAAQTPPVGAEDQYAQYPAINYGTGEKADQIKRGEYLVKMGDCIACHTEPGGKPFSGGLAFDTPFGTIYSPNISPDKKTGIGNWTNAQFFKAVREGIAPDGSYFYPAFPFPYYNKLTDQDLQDIRAYLNAIPAVAKPNNTNHMMFPFNWRFLQLGWRLMFFEFQKTGPYQPDPRHDASWNRGAYLVLGLAHCDMCHTSMYYLLSKKFVLGAPIKKYHLTGGFVNGFYAPNISGSRMKDVTVEQLSNVFKHDQLLEGGTVQGPMREANHDSFQYLTPEDVQSIYNYLVTVHSKNPPQEKAVSGTAEGKKIYDQYCTGCHSTGAGGAPKMGDPNAWLPLVKQGRNVLYQNAIHGIDGMPPKGTCSTCSEQDIKNTVSYIIEQSTGANAAAAPAQPAKQLTLEDGKQIYEQYCQACHNGAYPGAPKLGDKAAWAPLIKQGMDILILNTVNGIGNMPAKGSCAKCNTAQIKAAVKYMVNESKSEGDYMLW